MQARTVQEEKIWEGSPSQWLNFKTFFFSGLVGLAIVAGMVAAQTSLPAQAKEYQTPILVALAVLLIFPAFVAIRDYLVIRFTRYAVTSERVRLSRGIFSKRTDDMELYRVDDILLVQPFLLRLVSRGNLVLMTSDRTTPQLLMRAIPQASELRDQLRRSVEICRDRKKTRVLDFQ